MGRVTHPFLIFLFFYFTLAISLGVFLIDWNSWHGYVMFFGFELLFVGLAYDLTELAISLMHPPTLPPTTGCPPDHPRVALLVTLCDDVLSQVLDRLIDQDYRNYDIFILDDSQDSAQQAIVNKYPFRVLRRGSQHAFKAGNLNNWLNQFAHEFKYFAILDSDSLVEPDFLSRMVGYAEHPDNKHIAIFQSKIVAWNTDSFLAGLLGSLSPLRMYILERVGNRMGGFRSFGHNNLLRTTAVMEVGGFHEGLTPEDTVLSIMLDAKGYTTSLVDVVTYDTEPADILRFIRRTTRWAAQTVEVFRLPWQNASTAMKLSLHYNLYIYLRPAIYLSLLAATVWLSFSDQQTILPVRSMIFLIMTQRLNVLPLLVVLSVMTGLWILPLLLHLAVARRIGISLRTLVVHSIFSIVVTNVTVVHTTGAMLKAAFGMQTEFVATNSQRQAQSSSRALVRTLWPATLLSTFIVAGVVFRNQSILLSLNCLWLALLVSAPFLIWAFGHQSASSDQGT